MMDKNIGIKSVAVLFSIFCAIFLSQMLGHADDEIFQKHALLLIGLSCLLIICSFFVTLLRKWAKDLFVIGNIFCLCYLLVLYKQYTTFIPVYMLALNGFVVLYFLNPRVRGQFVCQKHREWKSVLVVDDDETVVKTLRPILIKNGLAVLTASTGEEGLRIAKQRQPDLIILDVILPGIKGRDVCKQLKENEETKDIPVVFLTAKESEEDIKAEMAAGAEMHLTKPVSPAAVISMIQVILKKSD